VCPAFVLRRASRLEGQRRTRIDARVRVRDESCDRSAAMVCARWDEVLVTVLDAGITEVDADR